MKSWSGETVVESQYPNAPRIVFHTSAPSEVKMANCPMFILDIPAGIEISCRIAGISRPIKVDMAPCLSK